MRISATYRPHQKDMIAFAHQSFSKNGGFAWWYAGCRVGKTLASLGVAAEIGAKRILVLTKKAAIRSAWQHDLDNFVETVQYILLDDVILSSGGRLKGKCSSAMKAVILKGFVKHAEKQVVVVVNYETARLIAPTLKDLEFDLVIADESHALKSHNSKQSKALAIAFRNVPYKLIMTGTGWDDRPTDVYGQVRFLSPAKPRGSYVSSKLLSTWTRFFDEYVNYFKVDNIPIIRGYKNLDKLQEVMRPFTLVIKSEDVLDLPPVEHVEVTLPMPKAMKDVYKELEEEMITVIDGDAVVADNRLVQALRLHQLTGGYYPSDGDLKLLMPVKDNPKLQATKAVLEELGNQPVVIFTRFTQDVALIATLCASIGLSYKKLVGGLHEHIEWQAGEAQVLIANIQAGGTGVNLNRARYVIYYSIGYSRTDYEQSLWRVRAQPDPALPVTYWQIRIAGSIDVAISNALKQKGKVSDFLLDSLKVM